MNQSTIANAANVAAEKSKNVIGQQIDKQVKALGGTVTQTARDLEQIGEQLRQSGTIGSAAQLADSAAQYVNTVGEYLTNGTTDRFIADLETFSRARPWAVAASAAALGFVAARVVKSSSARRLKGDYVENYATGYSADNGAARSSVSAT